MKELTDKQLKTILQTNAPRENENPWFTPRLLNRLPPRRQSHRRILRLTHAIAAAGCAAGWILLGTGLPDSAPVRMFGSIELPQSLLLFVGLTAVTATVIAQIVASALRGE